MQGGGAYIESGASADFTGCNLYDNEAYTVRACILKPLDSSSIAPLNSDTLRCSYSQNYVGARI